MNIIRSFTQEKAKEFEALRASGASKSELDAWSNANDGFKGFPSIPFGPNKLLQDVRNILPDANLHGVLNLIPKVLYSMKMFADQQGTSIVGRGWLPRRLEHLLELSADEEESVQKAKGPDLHAFLHVAPKIVSGLADISRQFATELHICLCALTRAMHALAMPMCEKYEELSIKQFKKYSGIAVRMIMHQTPEQYRRCIWPQLYFELVPALHLELYNNHGLAFSSVCESYFMYSSQ